MGIIKPKRENLTDIEIRKITKKVKLYLESNRDLDGSITIRRYFLGGTKETTTSITYIKDETF